MPVSRPPRSRGHFSTSPLATANNHSSEPSPKPSSTTTSAPADIEHTLRRGHPGSANLRAALKVHTPGHGKAKSQLERRFRRLLIKHRIELPLRNEPLGRWTIDCLWPARRVAVELDGRQHERPNQADRDDDRDLWLRRNRYIARRYGDTQVTARPDDVIADLRDAFAQAVTLGYATG